MDRSAVTQRVWELAEPLALAAGLELVDVQYRPEGGRIVLRLLLDRPEGGVTLDELTRVSRELGDVLDAHDAVPGRYHLECSSPGLNRPLVREPHFRRARSASVCGCGRGSRSTTGASSGACLEAVTAEGVTVVDHGARRSFVPLRRHRARPTSSTTSLGRRGPHAHA